MTVSVKMGKEKRFISRTQEEDSVKVKITFAPGAKYLEKEEVFCLTEDISSEGIRIWMFSQPPKGSEVQLSVIFKNPVKRFAREGRIMWVRKHSKDETCSVGIKFTDTDKDIIGAWDYILDKKLLLEEPKD